MFKAATAGPSKAITANRLDNGLVVFLDAAGGWSVHIAEARLIEDAEMEEAMAYGKAQDDARVIVEPYAIDVEVTEDGVPVPVRLREKIRADRGPTIAYGKDEYATLVPHAGSKG
jgi:hypothetical protein